MAKSIVTFTSPLESALEGFPEHVRAIGMISIEIANMEGSIALLLGALLNIDAQKARIVFFTPKASIARLDIVQNLIDILPPEHAGAKTIIEKLLKRARSVFGKRHEIVHSGWGFSKELNQVIASPLPGKRRFQSEPVELSELTSLIEKIRRINTDAWNQLHEVEHILRPDTSSQMWIEVGPPSKTPIKHP